MANVIDFRNGSMWGHALHTETMREVPPNGLLQKFQDWWRKAYRVSAMIHTSPAPNVGDKLAYARKNGGSIVAPIIAVRYCGDPRDMFTVQLYVTPDCRTEH